MSPAGWTAMITNMGASIQWTNPSPLAVGASVTGFMFDSTMTPAQFLGTFPGPELGMGDPITTAFLCIGVPFGNPMNSDPGAQITAMPAAVVGTLEPSTLSLAAIAMGLLALAGGISRKRVVSSNVLFPFLSGSGICGIGVAAPVGVGADSFEVKSAIPPDGFCSSPL